MALPDLITSSFATQALAAGGTAVSAAQAAHLDDAIAAASRIVRRWCGDRDFTRATYTRDVIPDLSGLIFLDQFPVNAVSRIAGGRTTALTIRADATNQRATVGFSATGDEDAGLVVTGLTLTRVASGTTTTNTLPFATYPTLATLAAAVSALPTWTATAAAGLSAWPSSELIGGDVTRGALEGADLDLFSRDLDGTIDRPTGMLRLVSNRRGAMRWGDSWSPACDVLEPVRVTWDAGFDTVPLDVQEATAEAVHDMLNGLGTNSRLQSETVGNRSQVLNTTFFADYSLTKPVMGKLAPWRIIRA